MGTATAVGSHRSQLRKAGRKRIAEFGGEECERRVEEDEDEGNMAFWNNFTDEI